MMDFRICLDSVKFPTSVKSRFNDVILQVQPNGVVLKSAARSGNIMTRCMIRQDFFSAGSFKCEVKTQPTQGKPLLEFCLPFAELKHIVEGLVVDNACLQLKYPVGDNKLQIQIPEKQEAVGSLTVLLMDTYDVTHTLDADFSFKQMGIAAQFFGRTHHFKKALKEFYFLDDAENLAFQVATQDPYLTLHYENPTQARCHSVRFN